jgi:NAD-dependent SIR2 family protein deacetylase
MTSEHVQPEDLQWQCAKCKRKLVVGSINVGYMGNRFTVELPHCPGCGRVLISEQVALGKMAQVEQMLENK